MVITTFIGAGNMANSLIGGLIGKGHNPEQIIASDPNPDALAKLTEAFAIVAEGDNQKACLKADIVVLAVKPQVMKVVAENLRPTLKHRPLIISIAAGISCDQLSQWLDNDLAIVRCMPNTPALVGIGASGLYANVNVDEVQKQAAEQLLNAVGISIWLDKEALIDTVTAVSGSGPAYFFLLMEAMVSSGVKQGLTQDQALQLTLQTAAGAAKLAKTSGITLQELRQRVTSPGGTTEQAIHSFEQSGFSKIVDDAMVACSERSQAMAKEFS